MRRRDFIALTAAAIADAALGRIALAQQAKLPRIMLLAAALPSHVESALRDGLRDHGWVDGSNVSVQLVTAPTYSELDALVPAAVATKPDVILAWGITAVAYARQQTSTIPIVLGGPAGDPLGSTILASWAHPGDNVTGTTLVVPDLLDRQMGILKTMLPSVRRAALLNVPDIAVTEAKINQAVPIAKALGLDVVVVDFVESKGLSAQFPNLVAAAPDVIYVPVSPYFDLNRDVLYDLLVASKLPALSSSSEPGLTTPFAGVLSYGVNADGVIRKSGYYVDAILKGAKPSDLPIEFEQPTVFDVGVNTWAAKSIGFTVPRDLAAQANLVIDHDIRAPKPATAQ